MAKKKTARKSPKLKRLSTQHRRFINFILKGCNQTEAYIKAGYKARGNVASVNASQLLRNPKIKAAIQKAQQKAAQEAEITQKRILQEYGRIAFFNIKDVYDELGRLKQIHNLPEPVAAAIAEVTTQLKKTYASELEYTKKLKAHDKLKALDSLARIQGMFNDKLNLGLEAETLNAILSGLPEEFAGAVREALGRLVSYKRN